MQEYIVYRHGSNAANQSMDNGPRAVANVQAESEAEACSLAAQRVSVYNNQFLSARLASEVDAEEADVDERVEVLE